MEDRSKVSNYGDDPTLVLLHNHSYPSNGNETAAGNDSSIDNHRIDLLEVVSSIPYDTNVFVTEHYFPWEKDDFTRLADRAENKDNAPDMDADLRKYALLLEDESSENAIFNGVEGSLIESGSDPKDGHFLVYGLPTDPDYTEYLNTPIEDVKEQVNSEAASHWGVAHPGQRQDLDVASEMLDSAEEADPRAFVEKMYGYGFLLNRKAREGIERLQEGRDIDNLPGLDSHARVTEYHGFGILEEEKGDDLRKGDMSVLSEDMAVVERNDWSLREKIADQGDAARQYSGIFTRKVGEKGPGYHAVNLPATVAVRLFGATPGQGLPREGQELDELFKNSLEELNEGLDSDIPVKRL